MSSQLLKECLNAFETYGMGPEFQSYFMAIKSQLLASKDVAYSLVVLTAQEKSDSRGVLQVLGLLLDEARMGLENDGEYAGEFLEAVEYAVQQGSASGIFKQKHLFQFASLFRQVGLRVPEAFIIDPDSIAPPKKIDDTEFPKRLENLALEILDGDGTGYDMFNAIEQVIAAMPEATQASMAHLIATLDLPLMERCALCFLLSDYPLVQEAVIAGLNERLHQSGLSAETMMLLPMIRGWFPGGPTQNGLDQLIKNLRKKTALEHSPVAEAHIQQVIASIIDGAGAQSICIVLQKGSKTQLAMILIKAGYGIKDSFLIVPDTPEEAEGITQHLSVEIGENYISVETLKVLLQGALAEGSENKILPAPGFLDVIEACNLFDLRPQTLTLPLLLDIADPERRVQDASPQGLGRAIYDENALYRLEDISESWFENTGETRRIIENARKANHTKRSLETQIRAFLETRRDIWARRFLQTAVMLREGHRPLEWRTLVASAYGLMNDRALRRIPVMEDILQKTIYADDGNMR